MEDVTKQFKKACIRRNAEEVATLLNDPSVFIRQKDIEYMFLRMCEKGSIEIVKLLLDLSGSRKIHTTTKTILQACVCASSLETTDILHLLLSTKEKAQIDYEEIARVFVEQCEHNNINLIKSLVLFDKKRHIAKTFYSKEEFASFRQACHRGFRVACYQGNYEIVEFLLSLSGCREIDPSIAGNHSIITACSEGHNDIVELLLSLPEERRVHPTNFDQDYNGLMDAYFQKNTELFTILATHGRINIPELLERLKAEDEEDSEDEDTEIIAILTNHLQ